MIDIPLWYTILAVIGFAWLFWAFTEVIVFHWYAGRAMYFNWRRFKYGESTESTKEALRAMHRRFPKWNPRISMLY